MFSGGVRGLQKYYSLVIFIKFVIMPKSKMIGNRIIMKDRERQISESKKKKRLTNNPDGTVTLFPDRSGEWCKNLSKTRRTLIKRREYGHRVTVSV